MIGVGTAALLGPEPADRPGWCAWWDSAEREEFYSAVDYAIWHRHGEEYSLSERDGTVTVPWMETEFDLEEAARSCSSLPPDQWADHLYDNIVLLEDRVVVDRRRQETFSEQDVFGPLDTIGGAIDGLAIHIAPIAELPAIRPVARWLPYGLAAALVHTDGAAATFVDRRQANRWTKARWADDCGKGPGLGWLAALHNGLKSNDLAKDPDSGHGGAHMVFTGPAGAVGAHLADLGWGFDTDNPHGAVLAVPSPRTLLFLDLYPDEAGCHEAVAALAADARSRWAGSLEPVSPHLMWWAPEHAVCEFARVNEDGFELAAPDSQLNALGYRTRLHQLGPSAAGVKRPAIEVGL